MDLRGCVDIPVRPPCTSRVDQYNWYMSCVVGSKTVSMIITDAYDGDRGARAITETGARWGLGVHLGELGGSRIGRRHAEAMGGELPHKEVLYFSPHSRKRNCLL